VDVISPENIKARMTQWLATDYRAVMFEQWKGLFAYAIFREGEVYAEGQDVIYLRQFLCRQGQTPAGRRPQSLRALAARGMAPLRAHFHIRQALDFEAYSIKLAYRH
jgi:hypothetical protein